MDALDSFSGGFKEQLVQKATDKRIPISGTFELLPFCNMRCKMCYIVHEKEERYMQKIKNVDYWENLIDQAIEEGMLYALITGGEPFLYPGIRELLERINKKPIHLAINTNATLLNEDIVKWLSKVYPGRLNVSLYGGSNETYERLCGNPKGFEQVNNALGLLTEYGIPYRVHATITPENVDDFDKMIAVCNQHKAALQMVYYMFPPLRKDSGMMANEARLKPEQAAKVALKILKQKALSKKQLYEQLLIHCATFESPDMYGLYGKRQIVCRGGYASFWINWKGQISGCGVYDKEHIDLSKVNLQEAWHEIVKSTEEAKMSEECAYCKYRCICPTCAAAAFCETGNVGGTPEYLCEFSACYAELLKQELEILREEHERGLF